MISIHRTAPALATMRLRALRDQLRLMSEIARTEAILASMPPELRDDIGLPPLPPSAKIAPYAIFAVGKRG